MTYNVLVSNKRVKRQKVLKCITIILSIIFFVFSVFLISLFFLKEFQVNLILVNGNSILSEHEIESEVKKIMSAKIFGVIPQNRIFSFPKEKVVAHLYEQFNRLDNVEIKKEFPSVILVDIEERVPFATLCLPAQVGKIESCFFVDKTGFIFEESAVFSKGVYLKFFDQRVVKPGQGEFLLNQEEFKKLTDFGSNFDIIEIYLKNEDIYELHTSEEWYLVLDSKDDLDLVYNNFITFSKEMISDENVGNIEYIDLRFDKKIFYKWEE